MGLRLWGLLLLQVSVEAGLFEETEILNAIELQPFIRACPEMAAAIEVDRRRIQLGVNACAELDHRRLARDLRDELTEQYGAGGFVGLEIPAEASLSVLVRLDVGALGLPLSSRDEVHTSLSIMLQLD